MLKPYLPRIVDVQLDRMLSAFAAVCIEGPKWCGKTRTAQEKCRSAIYLGDPANSFLNRRLAEVSPAMVLEGDAPRLIDEWQEVPLIWDAVRFAADKTGTAGRFLLTGSSTPNRKGILHSGAGRIGRICMRPMSLWESQDSSGLISLQELCEGQLSPVMTGEVDLRHLIHLIIRGGWPGNLDVPAENAHLQPQGYIRAILEDDISRVEGAERDIRKLRLVLRSLARHESTTASLQTIIRDIREDDGSDIARSTLYNYFDLFERLYLLCNQRAFAPSARSSVRLKQAEKRHFCDPSLAAALLELTPLALLNDLETLGFLFEALCERDLRIYAESFGGTLWHYQDYKNREIDAIVALPDGKWAAFEIKLGAQQIDAVSRRTKRIHLDA